MKPKIPYWIFTGLLCAMMLMSATMYILQHDYIQQTYLSMSYPAYLMYLNAAAKAIGAVVILWGFSKTLKEWAYAGYLYILIFALIAHLAIKDGQWMGVGVGFLLWAGSYYFYKKLDQSK